MTRHLLRLIWNRKRRNLLLGVEIFFSFVIVAVVSIIALNGIHNWRLPVGFAIDDVWRIELVVARQAGDTTGDAARATLGRLLTALKGLQGVRAAAAVSISPYDQGSNATGDRLLPDGRRLYVEYNGGTDTLPQVVGVTVIAGRWFNAEDRGAPDRRLVLNARFATALFGDPASAIDQLLPAGPDRTTPSIPERVVGVIDDFRKDGEFATPTNYQFSRVEPEPVGDATFARPRGATTSQEWFPSNILVKVAPGTPAAFEETLVRTLQPIARDWSFRVTTLEQQRTTTLRRQVAMFLVPAIIAGFLILMVALGLMGVLWQNVTERTREFGLRRANGASAADIRRQVRLELLILASFATIPGVLLLAQVPALPLEELAAPPGVHVAGIAVSLAAIYLVVLACGWYPSRLATRIPPAEALRYE